MVNNKPVCCSASRLQTNLPLPSPSFSIAPILPPAPRRSLFLLHHFVSGREFDARRLPLPTAPHHGPSGVSTGTPAPQEHSLLPDTPLQGGKGVRGAHQTCRGKSCHGTARAEGDTWSHHAQPHQFVLMIELCCWWYPESICRVLEGALCIPKGCSGGLGKESRGYSQPASQAGSVSPHPSPSVIQVLRGKAISFPHPACSLLGHVE